VGCAFFSLAVTTTRRKKNQVCLVGTFATEIVLLKVPNIVESMGLSVVPFGLRQNNSVKLVTAEVSTTEVSNNFFSERQTLHQTLVVLIHRAQNSHSLPFGQKLQPPEVYTIRLKFFCFNHDSRSLPSFLDGLRVDVLKSANKSQLGSCVSSVS
jgi:hypothetical protein